MRRALLWSVALLYSLLHFVVTGILQPLRNFSGDFLASFPAWRVAQLVGRLDMYRGSQSEHWGPPPIWHYGPIQHLITLPLFLFPTLRSAYVAWLIVNHVFVATAIVLAACVVDEGRPSLRTLLIAIIVFCNFNPLYEALTQRTIELFELAVLLLAILLLRRRFDAAAGTLVGIAAMSKFLPLVLVPWLALRRRWRALLSALLLIALFALATQIVLGWQNSGIVLQLLHGSHVSADVNQSISGVLIRATNWSSETIARTTLLIAGVCWLALWSVLIYGRSANDEDLELSILIVGMVLLIPHNEQYYFSLLLIPYVLSYARHRGRWNARGLLLVVSFLIMAVPVPLSLLNRATGVNVLEMYLKSSIPFAAALLLGLVLISEYGTSCAVSKAREK